MAFEFRCKAVLFDLDGVLLDSGEALYQLYRDYLASCDCSCPNKDTVLSFNGLTDSQWVRALAPDLSEEKVQDANRVCDVQYARRYLPLFARPNSEAKDVLSTLQKKGVKLGVVTNQARFSALSSLRLLGLPAFDSLVTLSEVKNGKPSAEPVLRALLDLGVDKKNALFVGDAFVDVQSGRAAGVRTLLLDAPWNQHVDSERIFRLSEVLVNIHG